MKIVCNKIDHKTLSGSMALVPNNADDFYVLSSVVQAEDNIEAVTTRKLSLDGGKTQQKITVKLALKVETLSIDLEDCMMSAKGKICKENEFIQCGSYHTIHIGIDDKFELYKKKWTREQQRSIVEATKDIPNVCFIVFYDRECVVSTVSPNNIKNIYKGELKSKNFKPIISAIKTLNVKSIIVAGFSNAAEELLKATEKEDKNLMKQMNTVKLTSEYKNISNSKVVTKMMTDRKYAKLFSELKYVDDLREAEDFLLSIQLGSNKTVVGYDEVDEAFEYGAIKTLFMTDQLHRPRTVEERKKSEIIIAKAEELRAKICIVPVIHESGERLKEMGGLAGLLQFTYK